MANSSKKVVIIIIIIVSVLLCMAAGVILFFNPPFLSRFNAESSINSSNESILESVPSDNNDAASKIKPPKKKKKTSKAASSVVETAESENAVETEVVSNDGTEQNETEVAVKRPETVIERYEIKKVFKAPKAQKAVFNDSQNGNRIPYNLYSPIDYDPTKKYPIILFLHGAGEIGSDNEKQVYNLNKMFLYNGDLISQAFLLCPQSYEWWELGEDGTLTSALNLLNQVTDTYSCDKDRIYVTGLSMGGYATWDLLKNHGDIFAAGIPICGGGDSFSGEPFKDIPIRIFHGTADDTVNFSASQRMYDAILRAGGKKAKLIALAGVGHNAWDNAFSDRDTFSWLFAQNKATNPDCEYEYREYFCVKDANGKIIISDRDIVETSDEAEDNEEYTVAVHLSLSELGKNKLAKAYTTSGGKPFTVYWGGQKLLSFTATEAPADNIFSICGVFDFNNFAEFCDTVTRIKFVKN